MQSQPRQYFAADQRAITRGDGIEWEELPSLADSLAQRLVRRGVADPMPPCFGRTWQETQPVSLDVLPRAEPFREALHGLAIREVTEPEVFRHFFGVTSQA